MGVWIETIIKYRLSSLMLVTPCMGVWIETVKAIVLLRLELVTPCMGVWIETWDGTYRSLIGMGHTLYGCVD